MRIQQLSQMIAYAVRIVCAPFQAIGYLRGDLAVSDKSSLSYKDAGINIDAGNALVNRIKDVVKRTKRPEVIGGLGGFGALCALPQKYREPILVSGTDGVGTKLRLCMDLKRHDTIGIDLVAMCVNDLVVHGAEPLFFLDYYTTGKLDIDIAAAVISGIAEGCRQSGCTLVGGETAEMPGMYNGEDYDVAGFCVGVVEKANIIDGTTVQAGDMLLALDSSGLHSNGYSLVRKILTFSQTDPEQTLIDGKLLTDHLLAPTRIYVKALLSLIEQTEVHAIAHLTGGGFWENIPRVLPAGTQAVIDENSWKWPAVFRWLQQAGNVTRHEMYRTFNCGVGMVIAVPAGSASQALGILVALGETAWVLGEGSNLQALIEGCQQGRIPGRIAAVISNRADAYGLMRAAAAGIETQSLNTGGFADRKAFDLALSTLIDRYQPEAILLAGYMRILSTAFVTRYQGRILNVHPSLLPRYPGLDTHRQALGNGDAEHGTSVHFVTDKMDEGPVVLQARVPVFAGDNQQILARRVKTQEHTIYPLVVGWLLTGRLTLCDNLAWLDGAPLPPAGYAAD